MDRSIMAHRTNITPKFRYETAPEHWQRLIFALMLDNDLYWKKFQTVSNRSECKWIKMEVDFYGVF
jgi:hypothetical protein